MRGFDLYRITLAYLGVIFVLCAVVVFDPLLWIWPAGDSDAPTVQQNAVAASPGDGVTRTSFLPGVVPAAEGLSVGRRHVHGTAAGPIDPAEVVAAIVAKTYFAEFGEDLGEGDVSAQPDGDVSPETAMVARGSDVAYTVALGDSLGSLALRFYGDSALSSVIFEANRGLMAAPDRLRVGQVVIIPGRS